MSAEPTEFARRMNGTFRGILRWEELDALWARVRAAPTGWHAAIAGAPAPPQTLDAEALLCLVGELDTLLRREHAYDYCGIVYVDDPANPALIKIFDPNNLGSACSGNTTPTPPRWLLSRMPPEALVDPAPVPNARRRWWQCVLGS